MANVELSQLVKRLSKDFAERDGAFCLTDAKLESWTAELNTLAESSRSPCATELIALALRFEREGGEPVARGAAQLYLLAAGLTKKTAKPGARPRGGGGGRAWGR